MKQSFKYGYELDCEVGGVVAAYFDVEHYSHLHKSDISTYRAFWKDGSKITIEQTWSFVGQKVVKPVLLKMLRLRDF